MESVYMRTQGGDCIHWKQVLELVLLLALADNHDKRETAATGSVLCQ